MYYIQRGKRSHDWIERRFRTLTLLPDPTSVTRNRKARDSHPRGRRPPIRRPDLFPAQPIFDCRRLSEGSSTQWSVRHRRIIHAKVNGVHGLDISADRNAFAVAHKLLTLQAGTKIRLRFRESASCISIPSSLIWDLSSHMRKL